MNITKQIIVNGPACIINIELPGGKPATGWESIKRLIRRLVSILRWLRLGCLIIRTLPWLVALLATFHLNFGQPPSIINGLRTDVGNPVLRLTSLTRFAISPKAVRLF